MFDDTAPELVSYEGAGWYRRQLALDPVQVAEWPVLHFDGCNYRTQVYVNGRKALVHEDGFLPFDVPLSGLVHAGLNTVAVCVDNTRRVSDVPGLQRGWRPFGGILRSVSLHVLPRLHLDSIRVAADADGRFGTDIEWENCGEHAGSGRIDLVLIDASGNECSALGSEVDVRSGRDHLRLDGRLNAVRPWSPETPSLYRLRVKLAAGQEHDEREVQFGFRTIRADGTDLVLNGRRIRLQGFNRHEDSPKRGMVADPGIAALDLAHMKSLGCNFVRLAHYPHDPATLDLCDELGLLAMAEIPLYWLGKPEEDKATVAAKLQVARRQLEAMIRRDVNHPSIVFWSVSNETEESRPEVVAGNQALVLFARSVDPTRLAVHVTCLWSDDPLYEHDDVVCVNHYPSVNGRMGKEGHAYDFAASTAWWNDRLEKLHSQYKAKPILVTECGYVGWSGTMGGALGEDTQAKALETELKAVDKPYVCGRVVWCYADHPWPEEPFLNCVTRSPYGVVTRSRREKAAAGVVRRAFGVAQPGQNPESPQGNYPVFMFRPHLREIPEIAMPKGFSMRPMAEGEAGLWEDIWRDTEPYLKIEPGLFMSEFGSDVPATARRCFFIVDSKGCAVGTISAWYSRDYYGQDAGRVHWVGVRRAFQGRGLAKAALSFALRLMAEWHERAFLATSTGRVGAIKLYLDFGFRPDLRSGDESRRAWLALRTQLPHPALDSLTG